MSYTVKKAIVDYTAEVEYFEKLKKNGVTKVRVTPRLRVETPIDKVINRFKRKLEKLQKIYFKSGNISVEEYNY